MRQKVQHTTASWLHARAGDPVDRALTPRQREVLDVIRRAVAAGGPEPTLTAIGAALGGIAPPTVFKHVQALADKGYIRRHRNRRPPIELLAPVAPADAPPATWNAPEIGYLTAGSPLSLLDAPAGTISLSSELLPPDPAIVALRVRGDGLSGEALLDGDVLLVRPGSAEAGNTVVALIDGLGATVRRYQPGPLAIRLESAIPSGEPITVRQVAIYGVVLCVIRRYHADRPTYTSDANAATIAPRL